MLAVDLAQRPGGGAGQGGSAPPINDITTNVNAPPEFAPAESGHPNADRDMSYPAEWGPIVKDAYPDLAPVHSGLSRQETYDAALAQAEALGWTITHRDPEAGVFEAEERTALFRFVDDAAPGPVVDVRSKSRDGRGDIGANAARIRRFASGLEERLGAGVATGP